MPFGQKFGSYLRSGFGNAKNFLGNAYATTKKKTRINGFLIRGYEESLWGGSARTQRPGPSTNTGGIVKARQCRQEGCQKVMKVSETKLIV